MAEPETRPMSPCSIQMAVRRFWESIIPEPRPSAYAPISAIPPTSLPRLTQASPAHQPELPVRTRSRSGVALLRAISGNDTGAATAADDTVLYLAYGSNLAAQTFLGRRGIQPLSKVNVSAPSLRLTFDLPGIPYQEPCFANTAIRKIPKPPKLPPKVPDLPDIPDVPDLPKEPPKIPPFGPPLRADDNDDGDAFAAAAVAKTTSTGDPTWNRGLIGVVYEVTRADYAKIVATEGGGASYQDILVPCIPLPSSVGVPEKPDIPHLPRPFLAHTLFAPRLPDLPDDDEDEDEEEVAADNGDDWTQIKREDDDGGDDKPQPPKIPFSKLPRWARRFLLPARRPDPEYAQPSLRYLSLIRDGAAEHDLPQDYQAWLAALAPYSRTTVRQHVGRVATLVLFAPLLVLMLALGWWLGRASEGGRYPRWLVGFQTVAFNLVWAVYDGVLGRLFGDGERTEEEEEEKQGSSGSRGEISSGGRRLDNVDVVAPWRRNMLGMTRCAVRDEEKQSLLQQQ